MRVSVIGLGYIGLPTAAVLASKNIEVVGVDINDQVVKKVNSGEAHIIEPDLDNLVRQAITSGNLRASSLFEKSDIFIISVPTPFMGNHEPDISFVRSAIEAIAPHLETGNLIIIESTCPVGTTDEMISFLSKQREDLKFPDSKNEISDIAIAYCPERVLPGNIVNEIVSNDRIIGGASEQCSLKAKKLYETFVEGKYYLTDSKTAELCKLAENSFRDLNIAFANELSIISDKAGVNAWELIGLANKHPRVNILEPGPGVGGHCIAVDPWFIVNSFPDESRIIRKSREVNDLKTNFIIEKIKNWLKEDSRNANQISVACLGLSFKPDIDDLRESPAVKIVNEVNQMGFNRVYLVEPHIDSLPMELEKQNAKLTNMKTALDSADLILILVKHKSFFDVRLELISRKEVIDTVGLTQHIKEY